MPVTRKNRDTRRVFVREEAQRVADETLSYLNRKGHLSIFVSSWWSAGQRWARNQASMTSDQREIYVEIVRTIRGRTIRAATNQTDSASLKGITQHIDFYYQRHVNKLPLDMKIQSFKSDAHGNDVWSDETFNRSVLDNTKAVADLTMASRRDGLLSAGYIETTGSTALLLTRDEWGRNDYQWGRVTQAQCSATVRHPEGTASSWVGRSSFDIDRVNPLDIAQLAYERCKKSFDPVRIEPGRYQTILEPQAAATLVSLLIPAFGRSSPEIFGRGLMFLDADHSVGRYVTKLGLRIFDERISLYHDPLHPMFGTHKAPHHYRIDIVKNGVLTALFDSFKRHLNEHTDTNTPSRTTSYTLSATETMSLEDMISSTRRGLMVARLAQPEMADQNSLLYTGVTRDGLWLIENGVITKSVRNFRWTESPLFALNNVEQIGISEQVFDPVTTRAPFGQGSFAHSLNNVVVPPLKVNDFSFTSTIDAV